MTSEVSQLGQFESDFDELCNAYVDAPRSKDEREKGILLNAIFTLVVKQSFTSIDTPESLDEIGAVARNFIVSEDDEAEPSILAKFRRRADNTVDLCKAIAYFKNEYDLACGADNPVDKRVALDTICCDLSSYLPELRNFPEIVGTVEEFLDKLVTDKKDRPLLKECVAKYGLGEMFTGTLSTLERPRGVAFSPNKFRDEFESVLFAVIGFRVRAIQAGTPDGTEPGSLEDNKSGLLRDADFRLEQFVGEVAALPPYFRAQALKIVAEQLGRFEESFVVLRGYDETSPRVFQKPGAKSFLAFDRDVRRALIAKELGK